MKPELKKLLLVKNEDFIKTVFSRLQKLSLMEDDLLVLTDKDKANRMIISRNRYTYPIIKEAHNDCEITKELTHVNGNRRYFDEKYYYNGKAYILCNDWYYPSENKKNTKDTRTKFLQWVEMLEKRR